MPRASRFDLVIIGGGMTGLALACTTAGAGLRTAVIEHMALARTTEPPFDGRVTAIAPGSRLLLAAIGVWPGLTAGAEPILDIRVGERDSPLTVHYDHREIGDQPLGHIVENRMIRSALLERTQQLTEGPLTLAAPDEVDQIERGPTGVRIRLKSGQILTGALAIAADGRESRTRALAGIDCMRWDYGQTGIVATIAHAEPHDGLALERFFPARTVRPLTHDRQPLVDRLGRRRTELAQRPDRTASTTTPSSPSSTDRFGDRAGDPCARRPPLALSVCRWSRRSATLIAASPWPAMPRARSIRSPARAGTWRCATSAALAELIVDAKRLGLDVRRRGYVLARGTNAGAGSIPWR